MRIPLLTLLLATGAALPARPQAVPPVPPPSPQIRPVAPVPARPVEPRPADIQRLRGLIEAAEKAANADDEDSAWEKADEAEVLTADWSQESLRQSDVAALLERLSTLTKQLEEAPAEPAAGLKMDEEVVGLSGEDLRAELERVRSAEAGVVYDFPIDLNDQVLTWVNIFTGRIKGKIESSLSRGSRYLPMIRQVFQEEGVPQDLAFLPLIESGYINHVKSYASAVGMWQFMRPTGRIFGLNGNAWVEERRDPVKATRAAAKYLKRLYQVSGDWYLALIGYNAGPLTTERAIAGLGTRNFWDMSRSRFLRTQTKNYVPEMCAAVLVGRHPERYGLNIQQQVPYVFETVEVDRMTSLAVMARFAGTDVEGLKDLNPELLRGTTPPGRYTLRVPPGTSGAVNRALARIPAGQRLDFRTYVVRKGDTLARVAARFKIGQEDLLTANDLRRDQFRPGKKLQVPPASTVPIDDRDLLPPEERRRILGDQPLDPLPALPKEGASLTSPPSEPGAKATEPAPAPKVRETVSVPPSPAPALEPETKVRAKAATHVVKRGETLFAIAKRFGVSMDELKRWNHLRSGRVLKGQRLRVAAP